ncbi:uncharacterized protein [Amphiura filiformis]|uniref:uncharacterized protein n=1 Tax=Amphiura filiformis TaxID=82378 RepID=UPI003B21613A
MDAFGRHVHIQIQEGDITNVDTESFVRFIYPGADDLDGLLDAAGDLVRHEYVQEKARGGVICTSAGNIGKTKRLFHIEVRLDKSPVKFTTALHTTLMSADEQDLRSIAFPGLPLCPDKFLSAFMGVIYDFEDCEDPRCLHLIKTVIPAERAVEMIQMTKYIDISKQKMENSYFHNRDNQDERAPLELENTDELSELHDAQGTVASFANKHQDERAPLVLENTDELSELQDAQGTVASFANKYHVVGSEIETHSLQTPKQERNQGADIRKRDSSPGTNTIATEESNSISEQVTTISSSTFDQTDIIFLESQPVVLSDNINDASSSTDATNNVSLIQPNTTAKKEENSTMYAIGRHVHIQIKEGDITDEDTESLVRFIYPGVDDVDGLLDAAGDLVRQEYAQEKARGGLYVNRGVVCSSAGNIGQIKRLFHVEVRLDEDLEKFRTALHTTLRSANEQYLRSIAFPGLALCPDEFLSSFMEVVYEFEECENPRYLRLIKTVIPAERDLEMTQMTKYVHINKRKMEHLYFQNRDQQDERASLEDTDEFVSVSTPSDNINAASASTDATTTAKKDERKIMDTFGRYVHIQLQEGDITHEETDSLVRFIYPGADDVDGLLDAAGDLVRQEYAQEKAKGGLYVNRGVVCTSAGNIGQNKRLFHVEVRLDEGPSKFRTALHTTLRSADRQDLRSIAFPGLALCCNEFLSAYMGVIYEFEDCENLRRCLWLIRTVIPAKKVVVQADDAVQMDMIQMKEYVKLSKGKLENTSFQMKDRADKRGLLEDKDDLSELHDTLGTNKHHSVTSEIESNPLQTVTRDRSPGTDIQKQDHSLGIDILATEKNDAVSGQTVSSSTDETDRISFESSSTSVALSNNIDTTSTLIKPNTTAPTGEIRRVEAEAQGAIKAERKYQQVPGEVAGVNRISDSMAIKLKGIAARLNVDISNCIDKSDILATIRAAQQKRQTDVRGDDKDDILRSRDEQIRDLCFAASVGGYDTCKSLLEEGIDVNCSHRFGFTPLHEASLNGHSAVCQLLLGAGANGNRRAGTELDERTPLHQAAMSGHDNACKVLLDNGAEVNAITKQGHEVTPLWLAAQNGHGNVCQVLLEAGAIVDARPEMSGIDMNGTSALHQAAENGHDNICELLLNAGADVNETSHGLKITPLWKAAQNGHDTVCKILLDAGAEVKMQAGVDETTPLHEAAQAGSDTICKKLLDAGAQVNARTRKGHELTPLWLAAQNGHDIVGHILLGAGALVNARASVEMIRRTALHQAAKHGHNNFCKLLIDAGANVNAKTILGQGVTPLMTASYHGHGTVCQNLLKAGAIVNAQAGVEMDFKTPLHLAAQDGHDDVCRILLDAGAKNNAKTRLRHGITPLWIAAQNGHDSACRILLEAGAIVNKMASIEKDEKMALHEAAQNGHNNVCKLLLDAGANVNAMTRSGQEVTPLWLAAQEGHGIVCQSLLKAGATVNIRAGVEMDSITPLYVAVQDGHDEVCSILLYAGAKINKMNLLIAAQNGHDAVCRILLEAGAIVNEKAPIEEDERTALHQAAHQGHVNVCKILLRAGAEANARTRQNQKITPLIIAAQRGHDAICRILLSADANVNAEAGVERVRKTALHEAAQYGHDKVCKILLDAGANVNAQTMRRRHTPLHLAIQGQEQIVDTGKRNQYETVFRLLIEAGADPEILEHAHRREEARRGNEECQEALWNLCLHVICCCIPMPCR